ncbi:sensor histidine kinase [Nannocystis radixulma]|uniref:histidine kinase n=1 Tax=Nannocystis radixulma TaxID=2995305 RepID=A0ABT5BFF6_9BACT|nr:sensor histidine kinase [Nannocystis radixulma]MDC0672254.1 PAS domain-containing protein [Nannocystis radixulma]
MTTETLGRVAVPLAATLTAIATAPALNRVAAGAPFVLFHLAVIVSAWFGGLLGGLLSTLAAVVVVDLLFLQPYYSLGIARIAEVALLGIFALTASLISYLVTRRKRAEERLRYALDASTDGLWDWNIAAGSVFFSDRWLESLGFTRDEIPGSMAEREKLVHPEDRPRLQRLLAEHLAGHTPTYECENRLMTRSGSYRWNLARGRVVSRSADGTPLRMVGTDVDISERKHFELALAASEARFRRMAEAAPVMIWLAAEGGGRTFFNERWLAFTGRTLEHVLGQGWLDDVHPEDRATVVKGFQEALAAGAVFRCEYRLRAAEGAFRWVLDCAAPFETDGGAKASIGSCLDITDLKEIEAQRAALVREQAVSHAKDELLAQVSHELRNPLMATVLWIDRLRDSACEGPPLQRGLDAIRRLTHSQLMLVNDLLDLSRLVFGKLSLNMTDVDLPRLVNTTLELVRGMAELKPVRLEVSIERLAGPVRGDPERLQQVLWNLVTNAIKFTPSGGTVTVRLGRTDHCVRIEVADTGRGIHPEFLPHVFDRFRQQDAAAQAHGGLGLGLSLVRELVELHHGTVRAESGGERQGARFTVDIPLAAGVADDALDTPE